MRHCLSCSEDTLSIVLCTILYLFIIFAVLIYIRLNRTTATSCNLIATREGKLSHFPEFLSVCTRLLSPEIFPMYAAIQIHIKKIIKHARSTPPHSATPNLRKLKYGAVNTT
jgi:hypothetical protein